MIKNIFARHKWVGLISLIVVLVILIGLITNYSIQKLDAKGVCWTEGRALNDDELYKQAMYDLVQNELDVQKTSRGSRPGMGRADADGPFWCKELDCDVWVAPPATYEQVVLLRDKFRQKNAYDDIEPSQYQSMNTIPEKLGWQLIKDVSQAGYFKRGKNQYTILVTLKGKPIFYPIDCCDIYTTSDWERLKQEHPSSSIARARSPYPDAPKYLFVHKKVVPEIDIKYSRRGAAPVRYKKKSKAYLYAINSCGRIQDKKPIDYLVLSNY